MSLGLAACVISTMALVPQPSTEKLYQKLDVEEKCSTKKTYSQENYSFCPEVVSGH